jgi:hypothetical protein
MRGEVFAGFKTGIWKLIEMSRRSKKGRCPLHTLLCEDALYMLLKRLETRKRREEHLGRNKWLIVTAEVAYNRIINCTNALELRNVGKYM